MRKFLLTLLTLVSFKAFSQYNYLAANAVNTTSTYTALGTNGTAITTADFDDANSTAQPIGFSFVYNGTSFTDFILNTNGFIKLGTTAPASASIYDIHASAETNLIAPLNMDLEGGTAPEYRVYTTGSVGSRICTIQFKNVKDYQSVANAAVRQFSDMDFQIKLYEGSNNIEFVYGTFVATANAAAVLGPVAGIKGSDAATSVNATKASTGAWSTTTFINGNYTGNKHNVRNSVLPTAGRTYRFVAVVLPSNDATVTEIYTLGSAPVSYSGPITVVAKVKNAGANTITNLSVSLNVSGANTFTNSQNVASLAAGATTTVTFSTYTPANFGANTVTVSVPSDDVNTNNSKSTPQNITALTFSYSDNSTATGSLGFGTGEGMILNKYTLAGTAYVTDVRLFVGNDANTAGRTITPVVLDATGAIIGQGADYVVTASDLGTYKLLPITTPPSVSNASFYVGVIQNNPTAVDYYPVGTQTEASPTRSGAYYTAAKTGGATTERTTFNRFMIDARVNASLPVVFGSFTGEHKNEINILYWGTTTESNNKGFEIERSANGKNFSSIGFVNSKGDRGNSNVALNYQYSDLKPFAGTNYYRLKQVDNDGKINYSSIVILKGDRISQIAISALYPNPVKSELNVSVNTEKATRGSYVIVDVTGKVLQQNTMNLVAGDNNISLNVSSLSSGIYHIRLITESGETRTAQFVKN